MPGVLEYDLVLRGGLVIDGSGEPGTLADVGIRDDRIARVDADGIPEEAARRVLDVTGLFVAPGFVDHHAHIQSSIRDYPLAEKLLRQGITTVIATPIPSTSIWHHSG